MRTCMMTSSTETPECWSFFTKVLASMAQKSYIRERGRGDAVSLEVFKLTENPEDYWEPDWKEVYPDYGS